jgi:hypothetical protein
MSRGHAELDLSSNQSQKVERLVMRSLGCSKLGLVYPS